ncbi:MAG: zinc metallopeptidase [Planctomycetota bacterium]|jgi:Zn-dependent membrane protease YugP
MFFDPLYWVIIGVCGLLSMLASMKVKSAFHRGQQVPMRSGLSGAEIARAILRAKDIDDVEVVEHQGFLSDHYNPMTKTLALSPPVFRGQNASAAGVAAHEVGHAIQHAHGYLPLQMRSLLVPAANIGSSLGPLIIIVGIIMGAAQGAGLGHTVAVAGVVLFGAATLFTVVTLPVEYDASHRAKVILQELNLTRSGDEDVAVKKVLSAAGLTYVAAAISSILTLLYWAMQAGLLGGRDD